MASSNQDVVGRVESLWRYPVKSMRGERLESAYVGFAGVYGDRVFAFTSSDRPAGFPWVTGREQRAMLLYQPRFRHPSQTKEPTNLAAAEKIAPGATPLYADPGEFDVEVETPAGRVLAIDSPELATLLRDSLDGDPDVTLRRSDRSMTDCRPLSLFSVQTARRLGEEIGAELEAG